jgi:hypothetical protein
MPMKLPASWRGWTVFAVALILAVLIVGSSQPFQTCIEEATKHYGSEALQKGTPHIFVVFKTFKSCLGVYIIDKNAVITALATIAIAYFTWTIWDINSSQLQHGRRIERAYISCGGARESRFVSREIIDGKTVEVHEITNKFQFHVNNYGKTPGTVFRIRCGFCEEGLIPNSTPTYKYDVYRYSPIDPDRRSLPLAVFPIPPELKSPAVFGRVSYKTIFGDCFSSAFIYKIPLSGEVEAIRPPNKLYLQEQREKDDSGEANGNAV